MKKVNKNQTSKEKFIRSLFQNISAEGYNLYSASGNNNGSEYIAISRDDRSVFGFDIYDFTKHDVDYDKELF